MQDLCNFVNTPVTSCSFTGHIILTFLLYNNTAVDWTQTARLLHVEYNIRHTKDKLFTGVVEIDESLFSRRIKYHRGTPRGHKFG